MLSYSTCSLNPVEDESVVAEILKRTHGAVEVVPCRGKLGAFETRNGLRTWPVLDDKLNEYKSLTELRAALGPKESRRFRESMWPPGKKGSEGLQRCIRLYPHLNDTGGKL